MSLLGTSVGLGEITTIRCVSWNHALKEVIIQDFLQVSQGSGIGNVVDNLTSADPPPYTTNGSQGDLEI